MRNSHSVVLDIDGVLADFEGYFCYRFGWENRNLYKLEERYPKRVEEIEYFVQSPMTYSSLNLIELGAKIARFCENQGFEISIVSSRPKSAEDVTMKWLQRNKIPFNYVSVGYLNKFLVIERLNPLFIVDDLTSMVELCANYGIPSFLMAQDWNKKLDSNGIKYRIESFDEFLHIFDRYFDL